MCPDCYEKTRRQKKVCFWCGREYTELDWEENAKRRAEAPDEGKVVEGEDALTLLMLTSKPRNEKAEAMKERLWKQWAEKMKAEGKLK